MISITYRRMIHQVTPPPKLIEAEQESGRPYGWWVGRPPLQLFTVFRPRIFFASAPKIFSLQSAIVGGGRSTSIQFILGTQKTRSKYVQLVQLSSSSLSASARQDAPRLVCQTRARNAIYWAEVELDTADFHFPDLRWPKIVQVLSGV